MSVEIGDVGRNPRRVPLISAQCRYEAFARVRVHDLKHTYGRRLRAAGVPEETRKALLGHKSGEITTHYSAPEIAELIDAGHQVCAVNRQTPTLTLLKRRAG